MPTLHFAPGEPFKRLAGSSELVGAHFGIGYARWHTWETWMGAPADAVGLICGNSSWQDQTGSYAPGQYRANDMDSRLWLWSQWMIPTYDSYTAPTTSSYNTASLVNGANGMYDAEYPKMAKMVLAQHPNKDPSSKIVVRLGWEMNGGWFIHAVTSQTRKDAYKALWIKMVNFYRNVPGGDRFEFELCGAGGQANANCTLAGIYPGDAYVDYVGADYYYIPQYDGNNPTTAFNAKKNSPNWGLTQLKTFADAHGKKLAVNEWGVRDGTDGTSCAPYVSLMIDWLKDNHVSHALYWESNAAFPGTLSSGQWPEGGEMFRTKYANGGGRWVDYGTG